LKIMNAEEEEEEEEEEAVVTHLFKGTLLEFT
jgi:hypothetical protein